MKKRLSLLFFLLFFIRIGWAVEGNLTLSYLEGDVEILKSGVAKWEKAKLNIILKPGDRVKTKFTSKCELKLADGSIIRLDENTVMDIEQILLEKEKDSSAFKVWWGSVKGRFERLRTKDSSLTFHTPTAVMGLRGTVIDLSVDKKTGKTNLKVIEGKVAFRPASVEEEIDVQAGEFAETEDGKSYIKGKMGEDEQKEILEETKKDVFLMEKKGLMNRATDIEQKIKNLNLNKLEKALRIIKEKINKAEIEEELLLLKNDIEKIEMELKIIRIEKRGSLKISYNWLTAEKFVNSIPTLLVKVTPDDNPIILHLDKTKLRLENPPYIIRYKPMGLDIGINEIEASACYSDGKGETSLIIKTPYYDTIPPRILSVRIDKTKREVEVKVVDSESGIEDIFCFGKRMEKEREDLYTFQVMVTNIAQKGVVRAIDKAGNVSEMPIALEAEEKKDWPPTTPYTP